MQKGSPSDTLLIKVRENCHNGNCSGGRSSTCSSLDFLVRDLGLIAATIAAARSPMVAGPAHKVGTELALALGTRRGLSDDRFAGCRTEPDGRQLDGGHSTKAGIGSHSGLKGNPGDDTVHLDPAEGLWSHSKVKESEERELEVVEFREGQTKQGGIKLVGVDAIIRKLACDNKSGGKEPVEGPGVDDKLVAVLEGLEVAQCEGHALDTVRESSCEGCDAAVKEAVCV